ncbi:family B DNA polymerase [Paraburkholderia adhaesiva]|uniref:family B DNA polymerase n=1 Tax=Paraburkholderia adhaesiva TaxID=2883244 RepID=UPI001F346BF6|nr:family B DNA polymerase [Paraburkholderia adhaesiva]
MGHATANPFVLPADQYTRDIDVLGHYVRQTVSYLSAMSGESPRECLRFVQSNLQSGGAFAFQDPEVTYLQRSANGDRELKTDTLQSFLATAVDQQELIAPTFTTYLHPHVRESLLTGFIGANKVQRGIAKRAMFQARSVGDTLLEILKDNEQTNMKLASNACSGAHVSASTPLFNPSAHSTLTSNCRVTASYGSANNEKLLAGNRHYWSPDVAKNNITSIRHATDYDALEDAMTRYRIRHPDIAETMACILRSTRLYFRDPSQEQLIEQYVGKLTPAERAAFVYTGDLYHLRQYNEAVVRTFIGRLASRVGTAHPEPDAVLRSAPAEIVALAVQLCPDEMRGRKLESIAGTPAQGIVASTVEHIQSTLEEYRDFIRAFFVTKNVPASIAAFPESIRRVALMGDTDSTLFTVQEWVIWFNNGRLGFDACSQAVAAVLVFLASMTVAHLLARMSANFGVEQKRLFDTVMKNEYRFVTFTPTPVAKHYYAHIDCREGQLYAKAEAEIKGVHLKSSSAPPAITVRAKSLMIEIMTTVASEKKLSLTKILGEISAIEHDIIDSVMQRSSCEYFRIGQIKPAAAYTLPPERSVYAHYLFWNAAFGPKYGVAPAPPYTAIKIPVDMGSPTRIKAWLATMADQQLAARLGAWLASNGRSSLTTFYVPEESIQAGGVPREIIERVAIRKLVKDTMKTFYLVLESLGVGMENRQISHLVSDDYPPLTSSAVKPG